jgi:hypothetical protein
MKALPPDRVAIEEPAPLERDPVIEAAPTRRTRSLRDPVFGRSASGSGGAAGLVALRGFEPRFDG